MNPDAAARLAAQHLSAAGYTATRTPAGTILFHGPGGHRALRKHLAPIVSRLGAPASHMGNAPAATRFFKATAEHMGTTSLS